MSTNKIISVALIIAGVALAFWGYDVYNSAGSQLTRALSGDSPIEAWAGMVGGTACIVLGVYRLK